MGVGRRFGYFALNYKVVYKVVLGPSSFSTFFSRFTHSSRTYTITTIRLDLALSTYVSCFTASFLHLSQEHWPTDLVELELQQAQQQN